MPRRLALALVLLALALPVRAQRDDNALSDAEVEQIRESAYIPNDRVLLFVKLLDTRSSAIQNLFAHPRRPGREQDTHDLLEQFTSIADELADNLDDYGPRHADLRHALPKVLSATDRWSAALKSLPDDDAYAVTRKLALESLRDLRESTTQLLEDQKTWFAAHPPAKENKNNSIDLPR